MSAQTINGENRPLTISVNHTSYPYHFQDKNGNAAGIMVDLWKLWAKKQQVDVEFVITNWRQTVENVRLKRVDIHAGLEQTEQRSEYLDFTSPFFELNSTIWLHRDINKITSIEQLLPYAIGVVAGSSHVEKIKKLHQHLSIREYKSRFDLFDAALSGEVVAFTNIDKLSKNYPRYQELLVQYPAYKQLLFDRGKYVAAVAKNNTELLAFIEQGIAKITAEEKTAIEKKWLGVAKKNKVLTLAYTPEYPPYMSISSTGKAQGLFIDIWREWATVSGVDVAFVPQSLADTMEIINQGGVDIHVAYPQQLLVANDVQMAQKVYSLAASLYVSNRLANITALSQLDGKKVAMLANDAYLSYARQQYPAVDFITFEDVDTMVKAAEIGEAVAMLGAFEVIHAQLPQANLQSYFYRVDESPFSQDFFAITQKDNNRLAEIIREGFQLLSVAQLIEAEKRWLHESSDGYYQLNANKITLTGDEQAFIEQHPQITVGVVRNIPPIEYIDENGKLQGINSDVNRIVEQRTGLKFDYVVFENWSELFSAIENGSIDMIASATATPERKQNLLFSEPYWHMPWSIIHLRELGNRLTLKDFTGKELAIIKGYHLVNYIRQTYPNIRLRLVDNNEEGLAAVKRGIVSGLIENMASASELINRESLITLSMSVVDEFSADSYSYAIRKSWPALKSIIDRALLTVNKTEKQKIYEKWFSINVETGLDKTTVLKVSTQLGIVILLVLAVIVIWNRRLYREIHTRKSLEEQMKHMATHDELTGLANRILLKDRITTAISFHQRQSLQMAVLFIDLDGFKTINDTYGHDVGDELLVEVANRLTCCVRKSDTIVRFGGDEFVLLLTGLHNKEEAAFIADKVLKLVQQPFQLSMTDADIGCSIGIAIYPDDGLTDTDLLKVADTLMYKVKGKGKNHYAFNQ